MDFQTKDRSKLYGLLDSYAQTGITPWSPDHTTHTIYFVWEESNGIHEG